MNIAKNSYKLLKKIKDPKFNVDNLMYYNLSVNLGVRDLQVFIFDTKGKRPLLLEDYIFDKADENFDQRLGILKNLYDDHHLLAAGFWNLITIINKNRKFSLVPSDIYQKEQATRYLALNVELNNQQEVVNSIHHKSAGFVNVFSVNQAFIDFFKNAYPNRRIRYLHQSSTIINGSLNEAKQDKKVVLFIDRFVLHIVVVVSGKLYYYNQFIIKKLDDYIRFIKLVASEINIDLNEDTFIIYGFLGKNTPHFNYLKEHIKNIKMGKRPSNFKFGYVFDEVSDHSFFDLYSLYTIKSKA